MKKPNIVYILADDLGYGDVSCLNENGKINTENVDSIAKEGMIFTDAHSGSAVCTPTRYGVVTGRYAWRTRLKSGVLGGWSKPLMSAERMTVTSMLKANGYNTGCVGKWHLGWEWALTNENANVENWDLDTKNVDFTKPIKQGPIDFGFDYYFGISGSVDMGYHYGLPEPWDYNGDWTVNFIDFEILADQWQQPPGVHSADIVPPEGDGVVDGLDLGLLVDYWLWQE